MQSDTDRREFIRDTAAFGFIFGWSLLDEAAAGQTPQVGPPRPTTRDIWMQAHTHMRDTVRPGLVIIVPENAQARQTLANDLGVLLGGHSAANQAVFRPPPPTSRSRGIDRLLGVAVFVCMPVGFARTAFPNMPANTALVLVDHRGNPLAYEARDPDLFRRRAVQRMTALIHGMENRRLSAFAQAQRTALGERQSRQVNQAIAGLESRVFRTRQAAIVTLASHVNAITAVLTLARAEADSLEVQRRLDTLLANAVRPPGSAGFEPLPYGVAWVQRPANVCGPCGRGAVPPGAGLFLRLLRFASENGQ